MDCFNVSFTLLMLSRVSLSNKDIFILLLPVASNNICLDWYKLFNFSSFFIPSMT